MWGGGGGGGENHPVDGWVGRRDTIIIQYRACVTKYST